MNTTAQEAVKPGKPEILRYSEAAQFLGIPLGSLYAAVHEQRIKHIRLAARTVLFRRVDLEAYLASHEVAAKGAGAP